MHGIPYMGGIPLANLYYREYIGNIWYPVLNGCNFEPDV